MTTTLSLTDRITLKHGAGGRAMRRLIEEVFVEQVAPRDPRVAIGPRAMDDGAAIKLGEDWLVVTTDSHVVHPIFFPGGDIGRLSVSGTVNDLAVMGAIEVLALTSAVVIEEGFARTDLERVRDSMRVACLEAGAEILTGDTKVMGRGEIDGLVLNTTGIGLARRVVPDAGLEPGDVVIVTGTIGDHGLAVLAARHDLGFDATLRSDVAPLNGLLGAALEAGGDGISAMKDPTRGGLAGALHEMAVKSGVSILIDEPQIPIAPEVRGAADVLGIDPLYVANEGKAVIGVRADAATRVLGALRGHPLGRYAAVIGVCRTERPGTLVLDTGLGRRLLAEPEGEPLPRIC